MKLATILFLFFFAPSIAWVNDISLAKAEASKTNKQILINFSGSDWCGPCIRMHKEIFDSEVFKTYASDHLVMVNADFPRLKKNQLSKEQQKKNDALAEKYNPEGIFPLTVLVDEGGKVINKWEGFPSGSAEHFVQEISSPVHASH